MGLRKQTLLRNPHGYKMSLKSDRKTEIVLIIPNTHLPLFEPHLNMPVTTRSQARAMQARATANPPTDNEQRMPNPTAPPDMLSQYKQRLLRNAFPSNNAAMPGVLGQRAQAPSDMLPQDRQLLSNAFQNGNAAMPGIPGQRAPAPPMRRQVPTHEQQVELQNAAAIIAEMAANQNAMDQAAADEAWKALCVSTLVVAWKALNIAVLACNARVNTRRLTMLLTEDFGTRWIGIAHDMWSGIFRFVLFAVALHLADVLVVRQVFSRRPMSVRDRAKASAALFLRIGGYLEEILPWLLVLFVW